MKFSVLSVALATATISMIAPMATSASASTSSGCGYSYTPTCYSSYYPTTYSSPTKLVSSNSLDAYNSNFNSQNAYASNDALALNKNLNSVNITKDLLAKTNSSYVKQNSIDDHAFALNKINIVETKTVNGINLVKQDHVVNNYETAQQSSYLKDYQNGNALNTAFNLNKADAYKSQSAVNKNSSSLDTDSFFKFKSPFIW